MGHLIAHLVRRGVALTREQLLEKESNAFAESKFEVPTLTYVVVGLTTLFFALLLASVSYTVGHVLLTLTAVETPTTETYVRLARNDNEPDASLEKEGLLKDIEIAAVPIPTKPITSKIRGAVKHLTTTAGFRARWRGLGYGVIYMLVLGLFSNLLGTAVTRLPGAGTIITSLVAVVFARLHVAWTHAIIAMPSQKRLRDRLLPRLLCWRQLALPTMALMVIPKTLHQLLLCSLMGVNNIAMMKNIPWLSIAGGSVLVIAAVCVDLFIALPLLATLTRIEAALLPEDEDTIVPVDRTFGGKVMPDRVTGACAFATFKNAFTSVNGEVRRRMAKLYIKMFMVVTAILFVAFHTVLFELWAIMGDKLALLLLSIHARLQQQL